MKYPVTKYKYTATQSHTSLNSLCGILITLVIFGHTPTLQNSLKEIKYEDLI